MENKRQFLGIWIPRDIYLNRDLSWTDKILLIEIESLDNERGCFASNDYFAKFLGVTNTTISQSISKLKKLGFVEQVSFDGRTRVLKADFKVCETQIVKKSKGRQTENLQHNKTKNKTINKDQKINKKDLNLNLTDDPKTNRKVKEMLNGSTCMNVEELKNERVWIEHCSRHLQLKPHFTNILIKQFIDEQILKDDSFKTRRETKSHFLNWAKIEVNKNRKFNESWGKYDPQSMRPNQPQRVEYKKPELSESEKKKLHNDFIKAQLFKPYSNFCETGTLKIDNFGGIVFKELQRNKLLIEDQKTLNEIKRRIEAQKDEKTKIRGRISRAFEANQGIKQKDTNFELELIKVSLTKLKNENADIQQLIKL
jgi:DNA-binding transcriptional regulator GbsR (MarR family)